MAEITDAIEPGSMEYGDRQVFEDRVKQINAQATPRQPVPQGEAVQPSRDKLAQGSFSERPITDGLSVGPGASPTPVNDPTMGPEAERYRLIAQNARNPYLRHLARSALKALIKRSA